MLRRTSKTLNYKWDNREEFIIDEIFKLYIIYMKRGIFGVYVMSELSKLTSVKDISDFIYREVSSEFEIVFSSPVRGVLKFDSHSIDFNYFQSISLSVKYEGKELLVREDIVFFLNGKGSQIVNPDLRIRLKEIFEIIRRKPL